MSTTIKNGKKNVGYRLLAALFALACVGAFFIPFKALGFSNGSFKLSKSTMLYQIVIDLVTSDSKLFGFIPAFASTSKSVLAICTTAALYVFVLALVVGFIVSFIAIFAKKKAPAMTRFVAFVVAWASAAYTLSILLVTSYVSNIKLTIELYALIFTCVFAAFYFVLMVAKLKSGAVVKAIQFLISLVVTGCIFLSLTIDGHLVLTAIHKHLIYEILLLVAVGILFLNLFVSSILAIKKKGAYFDLIRIIIVALLAIGILFLEFLSGMESKTCFFFATVAVALSILQVLVAVGVISSRGKRKSRKALADFANSFGREEYVETLPYEGGPVAGVRVAEEIVPVAKPGQPLRASGATYDLAAHAEGYDPFIALLNDQDRTDFTDLYILRCRGAMPEIPEYKVGGDNKEFFNKVFICLGQYREKIPDGLLAKMYDHSLKI